MKWLVVLAIVAGCAQERDMPACEDCASQGVHPAGYAMEASEQFHGKDLERRGWDLALCASCHGEDFAGRATAPSCKSCHTKGPTACDTCHGDPPATAAHPAHVAKLACGECHLVPASWSDHRKPTSRTALVTFGSRAGATATWNGSTCTNVYCHGTAQPVWTGGPSQASCGTCHGTPPPSHARNECAECHPASAPHVDGNLDIATACAGGCHGDATSAAPTTGAHRKHLAGGFFSLPLACSECHQVPQTVTAAGHIDSEDPAELTWGPLATARSSTPSWSSTSGTCTNAYCHGTGSVSWTASGASSVYCGSCHGLPPADASHAPTMTLTDCATCHAQTVSAFGNILVSGGKHINGVVDAN
jgi:predicted CxxxxCH...CXXCH cytochrome family protein